MIIPTKDECLKILKESNVPDNIIAHSKAVCNAAMKVADLLEEKNISVNGDLIMAAALLHDVKKLSKNDHVVEGYEFIKSLGFPEVASLIKRHGLVNLQDEDFAPKTWEEKIVFYADKRVRNDEIVSVEQRFEYVKQRYRHYDIQKEYDFTKKLERELLGDEKIE